MPQEDIRKIRCFLLDMDGTIYLGPEPIDGASAFVAHLRDTGRPFLFFTNNPTRDAAAYVEKLRRMGIEAAPGDILTSGEATARYLATETEYRRLYVLGTPSFENELRAAGLEVTGTEVEAVVLSFDTTLTYEKLKTACLLLARGLPYIATNPDRLCPVEYGYIPDCGSIAALLEAATGRVPKYIGKPNAEMIRMGLLKLGADPAETAMVGDRLYTDMEMAYRTDIKAVLVLSGETQRTDLEKAAHRPDFVFDSVMELHAALRGAATPRPWSPGD